MLKKKMRRAASLALAGTMVLSLAACGGKEEEENKNTPVPTQATQPGSDDKQPDGDNDQQGDNPENPVAVNAVEPHQGSTPRTIRIGTWYDHYYDSTHDDIYDNPEVTNPETSLMQLENVRRIEKKYNIRIEYVNLTWDGIMESINTSILSGTPDCDVYEVDLQFGIPAVLNGYAAALEDIVPKTDDIFTDQIVFKYLQTPGSDKSYLFTGNALNCGAYPLGFNKTMLDEANLENPQDLYDRGEWTWEKFREYCRILTKDTDGDNNIDQWGYSGWWSTMLDNLLMSNGAHIAGGKTEELSSPATIEALDFMYQLYQGDKTAKPWNGDDWDINTSVYTTGTVGFWTTATWVQNNFGLSSDVGFEIGIVPWPIGPHGNQETNSQIAVSGNWMMIPLGVERPELVYEVLKEYTNWYNGDLEYRDETEWHEDKVETERNFEYIKMMGQTMPWFDFWAKIKELEAGQRMVGMYVDQIMTAAQVAEQYKQIVQDYLDLYLN